MSASHGRRSQTGPPHPALVAGDQQWPSAKFSVSQIRCDLVQEELFDLLSVSSIRGLFESRFWYPAVVSKVVEHSLTNFLCRPRHHNQIFHALERDSPYVHPQLPRPRIIMLDKPSSPSFQVFSSPSHLSIGPSSFEVPRVASWRIASLSSLAILTSNLVIRPVQSSWKLPV
jgi:hypothetical protein